MASLNGPAARDTGVSTDVWILDNNKPATQGQVQLINAVDMFGKMRKSLGSKRKYMRPKDIEHICHLVGIRGDRKSPVTAARSPDRAD